MTTDRAGNNTVPNNDNIKAKPLVVLDYDRILDPEFSLETSPNSYFPRVLESAEKFDVRVITSDSYQFPPTP